VTINLWGPQSRNPKKGTGIKCKSGVEGVAHDCGIPKLIWEGGNTSELNGVDDKFYKYDTIAFDGEDKQGYFGYKVIGLAGGGTLDLFGKKGATIDTKTVPSNPLSSGTSWVHLAKNIAKGDSSLLVEGDVSGQWQRGDEIVVTTTDYVPGHSEKLLVGGTVTYNNSANQSTIPLDTANGLAVAWVHNGTKFR